MAATTTPPISSLVSRLRHDYSDIIFTPGAPCRWEASTRTVFYDDTPSEEAVATLLHELAHAVLAHQAFTRDLELLDKEREAWQTAATELAPRYGLALSIDLIDAHLDTYRDWLHQRSLCPRCHQTGLQTKTKTYSCINCRSSWRVNDARQCALRRVAT